MATLEQNPGGSNIDLGHIQIENTTKNPGLSFIPEIFGDSDNMEAVKTLASQLTINISGIVVGNTSTINTFKGYLKNWAINGDGTTTPDVTPIGIEYQDDDGSDPIKVLVAEVDYTRVAGKISVLEYTMKLMQVKDG